MPIVIALLLLALIAGAVVVGFHPSLRDRTRHVLAVTGSLASAPPGEAPSIDIACLTLVEFDVDSGSAHRGPDCSDRLLVSPDGRRAAARGTDGLVVIDLPSGARTTLADARGAFPSAWSPGGHWLQWVTCAGASEPCNVVIGAPDGTVRSRLPDPAVGGYNGSFRWSPDDQRFFIREATGMFVGNGDGTHLQRAGFEQEPSAVSPDGNQVAYVAGTNPFPGGGARALDIYVAANDGTGARNLTGFDSESAYGAAWSPDGRTLAVVSSGPRLAGSTATDSAELWIVEITGTRHLVDLQIDPVGAQGRDWASAIKWSPDGSRFALESAPNASTASAKVVIVPIDGSRVVEVPDARQPAWSSDSRSIAVVGGRGDTARIEVMKADGSGQRAVGDAPDGLLTQLLWAR